MANILDSLRDDRGVRILDTQLDSISGLAGNYDLLYHTNGTIYATFARTNLDRPDASQIIDRQIWAASSIDGGASFSAPLQITARGHWDDSPALCQIDPTDVNSPIGMVFTRANVYSDPTNNLGETVYPYRTLLDTSLTRISPIDILTNSYGGSYALSLFRANNRFVLVTLTGLDNLTIYENLIIGDNPADGFLDNAWTRRYINGFAGTYNLSSLKVRCLKNGHLALVGAVAKTTVGDIPKCDLGVSFSSDDGYTWTAFQYLTNYAGTPALDMVGIDQCLAADIAEIGDNQLAIVYQEGRPAQTLGNYSSPTLAARRGAITYHAGKNLLFIGGNNGSDSVSNGIWVYNPATQTFIFHITPTSTPSVWSQYIYSLAISTDGKYLAAGTSGSLDIWDISATDPAAWTVVSSLRKTTTPALTSANIGWVKFIDDRHLLFGNLSEVGGGTHTAVWGGMLDVTNISGGITPLTTPSIYVYYINNFSEIHVSDTEIHVASAGYFWVNALSDGSLSRYCAITGGTPTDTLYDAINDEWILPYSSTIYRLHDRDSALTLVDTLTTTTNPMILFGIQASMGLHSGALIYLNDGIAWYDYTSRTFTGPIQSNAEIDVLGINFTHDDVYASYILKGQDWIAYITDAGYQLQYVKTTGKLRWGVFTYNPSTKLIDLGSDDLSLMCDTGWVPSDDAEHLVKPRICRTPGGNVCLTAFRYYPTRIGARPLALVTGVMDLENKQLGMKACIANRTANPPTVRFKSRVSKPLVPTMSMRVRLQHAQCLKMGAFIMSGQLKDLSAKACILGRKSNRWPGDFSVVSGSLKQRLRLQFTVNTGYNGIWGCSMKARILQKASTRFTAHFVVAVNPTTAGFVSESIKLSYLNILGMKAFLVSNR